MKGIREKKRRKEEKGGKEKEQKNGEEFENVSLELLLGVQDKLIYTSLIVIMPK